jgi:hypothetical protein
VCLGVKQQILILLFGLTQQGLEEEEFEDTKGVIIIRISKKNRQHNGQKKKVRKDKQRSTKHTHTTKDRVTRTPLKSGRISSSRSASGTRRVNLVTNPVISHGRGKDREVFTTSGTYPWSFVTQICHNSQPSHVHN